MFLFRIDISELAEQRKLMGDRYYLHTDINIGDFFVGKIE